MNHNFFADFGSVVSGERFIGREEHLSSIAGRVFGPKGYGSLSIIGLPRIGKTSLVEEAVNRYSPECAAPHLVARVDVGRVDSVPKLFAALVSEIVRASESSAIELGRPALSAAEAVMAMPASPGDATQRFFNELVRKRIRPICILDEFDAGRFFLAQAPESFTYLREFASIATQKASLILISKRPLEHLSRLANHKSGYWANVLMRITLRPFNLAEQDEFFRRLQNQGVQLASDVKQEVLSVCGRHPFLLDTFGFYAVEEARAGRPLTVEWFQRQMRDPIRTNFQQIVTILHDMELFSKAIQVMAGPQWDVEQNDVDQLEEYGVLQADGRELRTFSSAFVDYLRFRGDQSDYWPQWRKTERAVRDTLTVLLGQAYGPEWLAKLKKTRVAQHLESAERTMIGDTKKFGATAPNNILAYTYPKELYDIMTLDWAKLGEPFLGADKTDWSKKFELLARVRNPLAHNREEAVTPSQRQAAAAHCQELLERIEKWQSTIVHD